MSEEMSCFKTFTALFALLAATACSGSMLPQGDESEIGERTEPLFATGTLWPGGAVRVCLMPNANMPAQDRAMIRDTIRVVTSENWGRVANIHFWQFGDCQASDATASGVVRVSFNVNVQNQSGVGFNANGPTDMNYQWEGGAGPPSQGLILHEFGHALGFAHEQARADWIPPNGNCPAEGTQNGNTFETTADGISIMRSTGGCVGIETLSPWDIVGVQRAYGMKPPGLLVGVNNQCVDIPNSAPSIGTPMQVYDCFAPGNQRWRYTTSRSLLSPSFSPSTLGIKDASSVPGTEIQIFSNFSAAASHLSWNFENVSIVGFGEKCLDIPNASFVPGQPINLFPCHGGTNQLWTLEPTNIVGEFRFRSAGGNVCIAQGTTDPASGEDLRLATCSTAESRQRFRVNSAGQIKSSNGLCWDIEGGDPMVVAPTQLFTCKSGTTAQNQRFHVRGPIKSGLGTCMTSNTSNFNLQSPLQSRTCSTSREFIWDYYFNP